MSEWKKWYGGKPPLYWWKHVEVVFRNGATHVYKTGDLCWDHTDSDDDIVSYRFVPWKNTTEGKSYQKRYYKFKKTSTVIKRNAEDVKIKNYYRRLFSKTMATLNSGNYMERYIDYIGCTRGELLAYIESLWKPGMSWENRGSGGWEIDHIVPLWCFDFRYPEQIFIAMHYTNIQPLWYDENRQKNTAIWL